METFNAICKRASVREYKNDPIDKNMLEKLVDSARRAPTARAVEPWEFVVITNKDVLRKLSDIAENGRFLKDAVACIAVFCRDTKYYLEDGCAATENILLSAADLGLGACWVAGDKKPYVTDVGKFLNAGSDLKLVSLIAVGWPKSAAKQHKKRSLEDVIHWEKF